MLKLKLQYFGYLVKNWLIGKDRDAEKDWRRRGKELSSVSKTENNSHQKYHPEAVMYYQPVLAREIWFLLSKELLFFVLGNN